MKNVLLALSLSLLSLPAFAGSEWHTVLTCDGGAAIVDNVSVYGRGGPGVAAQVVIRNPQIVSYFAQNQAGGAFTPGEWIGQSYFEPAQNADALLNFSVERLVVSVNGQDLTVTTGGANWTFHNCVSN